MVSFSAFFIGAAALLASEVAAGVCNLIDGDVIALKGDTGKYVTRCNNCVPGAAYPDSANFQGPISSATPYSYWTVVDAGNGKIALKGDSGKYLSRCNNCATAAYPDMAFVHVTDWKSGAWAQWTCEDAGNGKIALKADTGKYLARCNNCVPGAINPDAAFVHVSNWRDGAWAQFQVEFKSPWKCLPSAGATPFSIAPDGNVQCWSDNGRDCAWSADCKSLVASGAAPKQPLKCGCMHKEQYGSTGYDQPTHWCSVAKQLLGATPPVESCACKFKTGDVIALQGDTGTFVTRCRNCLPGAAYPDSANFQGPINDGTPYSYWTVENTGTGKLALKGDLGNYLSRCNNCVSGAAYPDQAFVHVADWRSGAWAQWTCEEASDGKIALKADTGKYLARCNNCNPGGPADVAFVHVSNWRDGAWSQFKVVKKLPVVLQMQASSTESRSLLVVVSMAAGACLALVAVQLYARRQKMLSTPEERKSFVAL